MPSPTNPTTFRRRKKRQVRAALQKNGVWRGFLCPSKCYPRPGDPMNMAIEVDFSVDMLEYEYPGAVVTPFERVINSFSYYNCDNVRGQFVHYYEYWEEPEDDLQADHES